MLEVFAFFQEQVDDRRAKPRTERDVITVLVESEVEGRALSDGEILQFLLLILAPSLYGADECGYAIALSSTVTDEHA